MRPETLKAISSRECIDALDCFIEKVNRSAGHLPESPVQMADNSHVVVQGVARNMEPLDRYGALTQVPIFGALIKSIFA